MSALVRVVVGVVVFGLVAVAGLQPGFAGPTCPAQPCAGNVWHVPVGAEPQIVSMRAPVRAAAGAGVAIHTGNQFQGAGGNPGNQMQVGSRVMYRAVGATTWAEAPLTFLLQDGNNKYFRATLDAATAGTEVEYYVRVAYSDHPVTFVHGDDDGSQTTLVETTAQARPFRYAVEHGLAPVGDYLALAGTGVEARIDQVSGHLSLVGASGGPDVTVAPPLVRIDGSWWQLGPVTGSVARTGELEVSQALAGATITSSLRFVGDGVLRYQVTDWGGLAVEAIELSAASPADESFYGLGEKFDRLEQSGKVARVMAVDAPGDKGDRSYKVVPWFLSTRGYGFHLDATVESRFDLRASRGDRWTVTQDGAGLAMHLIAGPAPVDVLARFTGLVGRPPPPPSWAFAPWLSTDHWRDGGEVRYAVNRYRELGLPGSVLVFDSPWEVSYNDFTWNAAQFAAGGSYGGSFHQGFATPAEMLSFLDDAGFKVVVWMTPFLNVSSNDEGVPGQVLGRSTLYDEAAAAGYLVRASPGGPPLVVDWWKGRGSPVDFTNPAARAWFQGKLTALVDASGGVIAGFKTDDGESDFIPETAVYFDGRTGAAMKNGYSVEYHGTVGEVLGADGMLWSRSGYTGTQAFPGHWAGDNEPNFGAGNGLPSVVVAGLSAAMSGWSIWGHDIGGYQEGNPSATPADLFMRWTQFGALSPIMQIHRQVSAGRQYPWSYGDAALDNYRAYARLHTALFPYLYRYVIDASERGLPIMRPPVLLHPEDGATHALSHTYYFGDWLLVAPVITNTATTRTVYLPAGTWFDFFSDAEHAGSAELTWQSTDPQRMPLLVRHGAIIPMLPGEPVGLIDVPDALDVRIYPDVAASFPLHDGGAIAYVANADRVTVSLDTRARPLTLRVRGAEPLAVTRDGTAVPFTRDGAFTVIALDHAGGASDVVLHLTAIPEPADPDAGVTPETPGSPSTTGCGCQGSGSGGGGLVLMLALGLLAQLPSRKIARARRSASRAPLG